MSDTQTTITITPSDLLTSVELNVSLETVIGDKSRQVGEEEWATQPYTLLEAIIDRTAAQLALNVMQSNRHLVTELHQQVRSRLAELVAEKAGPIIDEVIDGPVHRTNSYGEPIGEPTTLRSMIVEECRSQLKPTTDRSYGNRTKTALDNAMEQVTHKVVARELSEEVAAVKAALKGELARTTGEALADAITKGLTR